MIRATLAAALLALWAGPASACDCMRYIVGGPHFERDLDAALGFATVVAEGVLVPAPDAPTEAMIFRPTRLLKGPRQAEYRISHMAADGSFSDCDLPINGLAPHAGRPVLMLLNGGPDLYRANRCINFQGAAVEAALIRRLAGAASEGSPHPAACR